MEEGDEGASYEERWNDGIKSMYHRKARKAISTAELSTKGRCYPQKQGSYPHGTGNQEKPGMRDEE
jgi:hypothetical protein